MLLVPAALAGNGPFFVLYDHRTHDPGEIEVMPMVDIGHEPDGTGYTSYMVEVDVGLAERLQLDLMAEGWAAADVPLHSTGFRAEMRWRPFDDIPLNPVAYVEYEDLALDTHYQMEVSGTGGGHGAGGGSGRPRERVVETRVILSDDAGPIRVSFNWINETDIVATETGFGYAVGASVGIGEHADHGHDTLRVGMELYGGAGDQHDFGFDPSTREHYASVNAMRHFGSWMVKVGTSVGLTETSQDLVRLGVGYEM